MKTAVEWLVNEINATDWWYLPQSIKQDVIQQAKEMEKEQNDKAYEQGVCAFRDAFYEIIKSK
jgi:hypothetical protein